MNSSIKTYSVLTSLFLTLLVSSYLWLGRPGLLWGFLACLLLHWFIYFHSDKRLIHLFSARKLEGRDPWRLLEILEKLSQKARIPTPQVYIVTCPSLNAFSIARHHKHSAIIISESIPQTFTPDELEAVLAHEVACIKRLDTIAMSVSSALMSGPFFLLFPITALIRRFIVTPKTYFAIDSLAAKLTNSPKNLAQALWKLQSYASTQNLNVPISTAHLFIVNPLTKAYYARYFQAQPPVEKRIQKLIGYFPI